MPTSRRPRGTSSQRRPATALWPRLALALAAASALPAAQALTLDLNFTPQTTLEQQAAFQAAASYWESLISTPVVVRMDVGFATLSSGILAQAGSSIHTDSYTAVRSSLLASATSATDASAYTHLQAGPALSFWSSDLNGNARNNTDTSGIYSVDNLNLGMTTANAKALGLFAGSALAVDGTITFNTLYAGDYQFDRTGGIASGSTDFITVAEHEIGHVLGFVSGVDDADYCRANPGDCGLSGANTRELETRPTYGVLDLFRYSAPAVLDLRVGGSPYFSVDGGTTEVTGFSTGDTFGNGYQASHFGLTELTLMRPFVGNGQSYDAFAPDLSAMDVIGWTLTTPVPEPATWGLMALGLLGVTLRSRRAGLAG